jgi:hypothetical protein
MNSFYKHHRDSIRWHYRCFDRILLNGLIQPFQQPERVVGFFNTYRQLYPVSRHTLRDIAEQFQRWLKGWSEKRNIPVAEAPKGRRDDFVEAYFRGANPDQVVVIVKAREPARIMTAIGDSKTNHWHLQIANRWVVQYNFYINDRQWGRTEIEDMDLPNPVIRNYGNGLATTRCQPTPRPLNALRIPSAMPIFALS